MAVDGPDGRTRDCPPGDGDGRTGMEGSEGEKLPGANQSLLFVGSVHFLISWLPAGVDDKLQPPPLLVMGTPGPSCP